MGKIRKILVPLDGSAHAEEIFPQIETLAKELNAGIALVRVVYDKSIMNADPINTEVRIVAEAEEYLKKIEVFLKAKGLAVESHIAYGIDAEEILVCAAWKDIDMIAMTTHGRSGVKRFLLGSVAEKILRHSPKPVYLVRCTAKAVTP